MKRNFFAGLIAMVIGAAVPAAAQKDGADPLEKHLAPPALIVGKADEIGLTAEQREKVRSIAQAAHQDITEPRKVLQGAYGKLSEELAKGSIDEAAAVKRLDQVLDLERKIKRRHLQMLVAANKMLKPTQRAKLQQLRGSMDRPDEPAEVTEMRLKRKVGQLQKIAEGLAAGRDSSRTSSESDKPPTRP